MRKLAWILLALVVIATAVYLYVFHKPHRDIAGESAAEAVSAEVLVSEYNASQQDANNVYLDQVIEVRGEITELSENHLSLKAGVYCNLLPETSQEDLAVGQIVRVKGRVVGYDELFSEVRLDNCSLLKD